ncbi:hypothetical protein Tco_1243423 [Tanacetum coccineum]
MSTSKDSSKGKSPSTSLKSSKSGKSAKDQIKEPIFGEDLGKTDEQPNDKDVPKYDWYKKSRSGVSPDPKWNEG